MASMVGNISNIFAEAADERVSDWFLMSSFWPNIALVVTYLALVYKILPEFMKNRKPFDLTEIIQIYNFGQILACCIIIYWMLTSGWIQGDYSLGCQPMDYSSKDPKAISLLQSMQWLYFLKITELLETMFFVLRKKFNQVTTLHVYHHVSTMIVAWTTCKYIGGPMPSIHIMMNCFIHALMYTYYYLASKGPEWQKCINPWKPWLTIAQMIQFTLMLIHLLPPLLTECSINTSYLVYEAFYMPNIMFLYYMFYKFYKRAYRKNRLSKKVE
ncbi:unnamed protein product [Ceutorhynchus assimilis]|uniref:Elongation of very long chain fatty acids protein n=1 Tax=Ceutorhynchus assimilis TaxID=467358 RepID=A0A9N9MIQ4_9CUCU|nr:unnamed protein product [Ceutorhynchus assimilis]